MNEKRRLPKGVFLFLATGFELTVFCFTLLRIPSPFHRDCWYVAETVSCTRETPRIEGLLETEDLELVEKFVMFQWLYTLRRTNNKISMCMCVYTYVYIIVYTCTCVWISHIFLAFCEFMKNA